MSYYQVVRRRKKLAGKREQKGFTIVEMAVVLVIIGIIMTMVVKGKELVYSANVRTDLAKVRYIHILFNAYLSENKSFPMRNFGSGPQVDLQEFAKKAGLSDEDFTFRVLNNRTDTYSLYFNSIYLVRCEPYYADPTKFTYADWSETRAPLCMVIRSFVDGKPMGISHFLTCSFENMLDDADSTTGTGRLWWDVTTIPNEMTNCSSRSRELIPGHRGGWTWQII